MPNIENNAGQPHKQAGISRRDALKLGGAAAVLLACGFTQPFTQFIEGSQISSQMSADEFFKSIYADPNNGGTPDFSKLPSVFAVRGLNVTYTGNIQEFRYKGATGENDLWTVHTYQLSNDKGQSIMVRAEPEDDAIAQSLNNDNENNVPVNDGKEHRRNVVLGVEHTYNANGPVIRDGKSVYDLLVKGLIQ